MTDFLGLDLGIKRTGIARASVQARLAEPLMTIETSGLITTLKKLTAQIDVEAIIVGLPRTLQGGDTPQSIWVNGWVDKAKKDISKPFYFHDEALTTKQAEKHQKKYQASAGEDAVAAAIILQDFLDTSGVKKVV